MTPAAKRQQIRETAEQLRMFRAAGGYTAPTVTDGQLAKVHLELNELIRRSNGGKEHG